MILLKFKLLAVVTGVVFENLFKDGEDWNSLTLSMVAVHPRERF